MYTDIVRKQYVGKSKLDFYLEGELIKTPLEIGSLGFTLEDEKCNKFQDINRYLPDYYIPIKIRDISSVEIGMGKTLDFTHILYITGVPKFKPLKPFRIKDIKWDSYYEDLYRGYLFQILKVGQEIELMNDCNNTKFKIDLC